MGPISRFGAKLVKNSASNRSISEQAPSGWKPNVLSSNEAATKRRNSSSHAILQETISATAERTEFAGVSSLNSKVEPFAGCLAT